MDSVRECEEPLEQFYKLYRDAAVEKTIEKLQSLQYATQRIIGSGSYGDIIEVHDTCNNVILAAKIVLTSSPGEKDIWKTLEHPNVLSLLRWYDFEFASVFLTLKYEMSLQARLNRTLLLIDRRADEKAVRWMRDILNGLSYLHGQGYCHLDLKLDNILLSYSDVACIADFGFLTTASEPVNRYGTPFAYRAPEASLLGDGRKLTAVDGKMFDIWTVGILCFELFTREALLKYANFGGRDWAQYFYPAIHELLKEVNFQRLMRSNFMWCPITYEIVENAIHFVTICLHLDPKKRPSATKLIHHPLLGGQIKSFRRFRRHAIWAVCTADPSIVWKYIADSSAPCHAVPPPPEVSCKSNSDDKMPEMSVFTSPALLEEVEMAMGDTRQEEAAAVVGVVESASCTDLETARDSIKTKDPCLQTSESSSSYDDASELLLPLEPSVVSRRQSFRTWWTKKKKNMSRTIACLFPQFRRRRS